MSLKLEERAKHSKFSAGDLFAATLAVISIDLMHFHDQVSIV